MKCACSVQSSELKHLIRVNRSWFDKLLTTNGIPVTVRPELRRRAPKKV